MTLSAAHTAKGKLQRALLELLRVHERDGTLPTSARFLFYELVQAGVVSKTRTGARRADQNTIDALTHLREAQLVPWEWIVDETRELTRWQTAQSVAQYVLASIKQATLDPWGAQAAPLILCESRSLAGVLRSVASEYACPIASTNGQSRGFLVSQVAPQLQPSQRVLYLGDFDHCGNQIEAATRRTLEQHSGVTREWERIALTAEQVREFDLPVISKADNRYRPVRYYDAVETEAIGQAEIVAALRSRLDELLPEPLDDVRERQQQQREQVTQQLRELTNP